MAVGEVRRKKQLGTSLTAGKSCLAREKMIIEFLDKKWLQKMC